MINVIASHPDSPPCFREPGGAEILSFGHMNEIATVAPLPPSNS
jgi:hypothetical protein